MSTPQDSAGFEQYLAGESPLSEAYREGATQLPPMHLDANINIAARRRVAERSPKRWWSAILPPRSGAGAPFSGRWQLPATLASVALVATLVVLVRPDADLESPLSLERAPASQTPAKLEALERLDGETASESAGAASSSTAGAGQSKAALSDTTSGKAGGFLERDGAGTQNVPAPAGDAPQMATEIQRSEGLAAEPGATPASPAPQSTRVPARTDSRVQLAPPPAPPASAETVSEPERLKKEQQAITALQRAQQRRQLFDQRRSRIAQERQLLEESVRKRAAEPAKSVAEEPLRDAQESSASGRAGEADVRSNRVAPARAPAPAAERRPRQNVDDRLEQVRRLITDGEIPLARVVLEALLRDVPGLEVPPDIQAALREP